MHRMHIFIVRCRGDAAEMQLALTSRRLAATRLPDVHTQQGINMYFFENSHSIGNQHNWLLIRYPIQYMRRNVQNNLYYRFK